jgi:hypothetical protein
MPNANEDVELARAWMQGKSALFDDLADLVESMMDKPLDAPARTFISAIGTAAKSKGRPASARIEAQPSAPPTPEAPLPQPVDLNEMLRRRRERERARLFEQFGRSNAEAWREQAEMVRGMGWGDE